MASEDIASNAKDVEQVVAPLVAAGDKLSTHAQGILGVHLWNFALVFCLVLLVAYWLRTLHRPIGEKMCAFVQRHLYRRTQPNNQHITVLCYAIIVFCAVLTALVISAFFVNITEKVFDINFAMLIMLMAQGAFWLADLVFRHKGVRRSRFNRYIVAHLIKYVIVFIAVLSILLIFDIHISEMLQWQGAKWFIPAFSMLVFVPFVHSGGLSAIKFALTHPIRIGDVITIDGHTGVFRDATPYAITLRLHDGTTLSLPLVRVVDNSVQNLQTRHSLEVTQSYHLSPEVSIEQLKSCREKIHTLFSAEKNCYLRSYHTECAHGYYDLQIVFNIRLKKVGVVGHDITSFREKMVTQILQELRSLEIPLWQQPCALRKD